MKPELDENYVNWLIDDQAHGLLNMRYEQIADVMGITRQTLAKYEQRGSYKYLSVESVIRLLRHIEYVKSALLTTEESKSL